MMRRIKLPGWIVLMLLLGLVVFGTNHVVATVLGESSVVSEPEPEPEPNETTVDSSVYPGLNIKTTTKETDLYTLSISQPYTELEQINQSMDEWVDQQKKEFTTGVKESKSALEKNDFRAHLNIQVETNKLAEKLYTLEFESYQITGGANGMTAIQPFVIDLNENKQLQLDDVVQLDEETEEAIRNLILEELHNNQQVNPYLFDEMVTNALENPDSWKWSVSRDHLTFYFGEYEIAAGAAGFVKANIPMDKIKPYLNRAFAEQIELPVPEKNAQQEANPPEDKAKLDPDGKYVVLTFDDGPHPDVTPRILDTLEKHNAKATFFMLGSQVEYYPELARRVVEAGHEIGNHTMNHQDLTTLQPHEISEEIQKSGRVIEQATGRAPVLLRPPYGASNEHVAQIAADKGLSNIMWSVDSLDWKSRNAVAVNGEVMANVNPGAIVLLHDIHASTADALPQLLTTLEDQGYQMITVSQLLELWDEEGVGPFYGKRV